ncbi:hypothetical protein MTR67_017336 [Solanum verrucosum]|uniref:Uncharacterized protein n=1 Tax=Solanum verrucosum TaxID=315347 RepID=A0AAF0QNL5_SOLVR|nr:hypothetical protein MTR67_017336 [Solanum verrucosum]
MAHAISGPNQKLDRMLSRRVHKCAQQVFTTLFLAASFFCTSQLRKVLISDFGIACLLHSENDRGISIRTAILNYCHTYRESNSKEHKEIPGIIKVTLLKLIIGKCLDEAN